MTDATKTRDGDVAGPTVSTVAGRTLTVMIGESVIGKTRIVTHSLKRSPDFGPDDRPILSVGAPTTCTLSQLARAILLKRQDNGDMNDRHD
jgi:hypothetical protein